MIPSKKLILPILFCVLLLAVVGINLQAETNVPIPAAAAASEVKVTLRAADGSTPVPSPSPSSTPSAATPAATPASSATPAPTASAPAPVAAPAGNIYENRLNDATGLDLKNGAAIGADASGVSGQPGDKAYTSGAASASSTAGPLGTIANGSASPASGDELTVTLWYKPEAEIKDATTLFNAFGSSLLWEAKSAGWVWRVASKDPTNPKALTWYNSGKGASATSGQWTFLALVWKRNGNTGLTYIGNPSAPAALVNTVTRKDIVDPFAEPPAMKRAIGNDSTKMDRAFMGSIDDVRILPKALDAAAIEKIRAADLKNEPVSL